MIFVPYFLALCILVVVWYIRQRIHFRSLTNAPGERPSFLMGNLSWVLKIYANANRRSYHAGTYILERLMGNSVLFQKQGMYCVWFTNMFPVISIHKPELLELILNSSVSSEKSFEYTFLHKWLGTGLLTSKGEKWKHRRRLLTPSFHFRILEDFLPVFNHQSLVIIQKLKSTADKEYVDITDLIILCTLDIICETIMGVSIDAQKGSNSDYVKAIHDLADYFNQRNPQPWLWSDFLFGMTDIGRKYSRGIDILHKFTDKVIKEKKEKLLSGGNVTETDDKTENEYFSKRRKTFMDLLLDMHVNGEQLSEADIREEVDTFMFEGHDTTAMGIIFALYCIGLYPEVQRKINEEIDEIFGEDDDRPINYDDTRAMKYLECVLKESQRLYPSVPLIGRTVTGDLHIDNLRVPKNTTIHCNLLNLHRNPDIFPNPEVFNPDRFLPENSLKRHPYAYIPFSAGPRNCIGQKFAMLEEKAIVCNILRHFNLTSLDPRDKFHVKMEFTLRPAQEVRLKFTSRRS